MRTLVLLLVCALFASAAVAQFDMPPDVFFVNSDSIQVISATSHQLFINTSMTNEGD